MKKSQKLAILLSCVMLFAFTACNGDVSKNTSSPPPAGSTSPGNTAPASAAPASTAPASTAPVSASPAPSKPAAPKRDTLTVSTSGDTGTLDPIGMSGAWISVGNCYMEPLFCLDERSQPIWLLATGIDKVSSTEFTVHIRKGVTFSNGNPLTSDDVLFTLKLWKDTPNRAYAVRTIDFDKTKKIDDLNMTVVYTQPILTKNPSLGSILVTDAESYNPKEASAHPIGTGPYVVTEYLVNSYVKMKTLKSYWGTKPAIENVTFKVINEDAQKVNAIETNAVDISPVPSQEIKHVQGLPGYEVKLYKNGNVAQIFFNVNKASIFSSQDARYAVCFAIDREAIAKFVYNGFATVPNNPCSMATTDYEQRFGNLNDTYSKGHNLELAKQYATKAGLTGKKISIMTNGAPDFVSMAEIIQTGLKDIGVTAEIRNYDQATLRGAYRTNPTMYDLCLYYSSAPDLTSFTQLEGVQLSAILMADGAWEGLTRFNELRKNYYYMTTDQQHSDALFEMMQIFAKACPWYAVSDLTTPIAYSKDIRGFALDSLGSVLYSQLSFA